MGDVQPTAVVDKASLSDLRRSIRADLAGAGADPSITFDCLIAVTEACTAALLRCEEASDAPDISWEVQPGCICFTVSQTCTRSRSQASHPSRALDGDAAARDVVDENLPIGLIGSLMDEVSVQDGPAGRIVTLTKLLC